MKVGSGCYKCLLQQAEGVLDRVEVKGKGPIMVQAMDFLQKNYGPEEVPGVLGSRLHHYLMEMTEEPDPFHADKTLSNENALSLLEHARELIEESEDPFTTTIRVSMAGNLMDFGIYRENTPVDELKAALKDVPVIDDTEKAREFLQEPRDILYLLDNAGEVVFDRLLIEMLLGMGHTVTAAVKSEPIVNDALMEDADTAGITELVPVIESGNNYVGTVLEESSEEFLEAYHSADLIIAKGQGHFETLGDTTDRPILFLLKAKCISVAEVLEVPQKSSIVLLNLPHDET